MKNIHIPTLIILSSCIFCISSKHFDFANAIQSFWSVISVILIFSCLILHFRLPRRIIIPHEKILKTICIIGLFEILYAILQLFKLVPDNYEYAYFSGSLNNPAIFGMLLSFCVPISLYYTIISNSRNKIYWGVLCIIYLLFIILSNSRTAIISALIGMFIILVMEQKLPYYLLKKYLIKKLYVILLIFITLLFYYYKQNSADGRMLIWSICCDMIKEKPLSGWGSYGFTSQYMNFQADFFYKHPNSQYALLADNIQHPFNEFIYTAVLYGIPFTILFILIIILCLWFTTRKVKEYRSIITSFICIFIIWCLFSYPLQIPFMWILLSLFIMLMLKSIPQFSCPIFSYVIISVILIWASWGFINKSIKEFRRVQFQESMLSYIQNNDMSGYERMYKDYTSDGAFLYNYGAVLHYVGEYEKSNTILNECSKYITDYDLLLLRGDNLQKIGKIDSALICYQRANMMIPNRFLPLYYQMKLYQEHNNLDKAKEVADNILHKQVKIKGSPKIKEIMHEAENIKRDKYQQK